MKGYRIYAATGALIGETCLNLIARAIVRAAQSAPAEYKLGEIGVWLDGQPVDISDWGEPAASAARIDWGNHATVIPEGI